MKNLLTIILALISLQVFAQNEMDSLKIAHLEKQLSIQSEIINSLSEATNELQRISTKLVIINHQKNYSQFPVVEFDFVSKDFIKIPKKIKEGDFYQIKVTGLNLNQYSVVINSEDTIYSKPMDFPTFGTLDLSSLSGLVGNLATSVSSTDSVTKELDDVSEDAKSMKSIFERFNDIESTFGSLIKDRNDDKNESKSIELKIDNQVREVHAQSAKFLANLIVTNETIDKLKFNYTAYGILSHTQEDASAYKPDIMDDLKAYETIRETLGKQKKAAQSNIDSLKKFVETDEIKRFLADTKNVAYKDKLTKAQESLDKAKGKISKALGMVSSENIDKQMRAVFNLYADREFVSLPIQFNGEQAKLSMKFIPKDTTNALQPYELSPIVFPARKFYWSVGTSLYHAKLRTERVGTEKVQVNDSTTQYKLLSEDPLEAEIGTALMIKAGYNVWSWFGLHGTVGTGLSLGQKVQPRMMLGAGISIGNKNALTVDFGSIGGYVDRVSKNADFIKNYVEKPEVLINELKFSSFWSVGYIFKF